MARRSRRASSSLCGCWTASEVAHATGILDLHRPADVHDRAITGGIAPAAHVETVAAAIAAEPIVAAQRVAVSDKLAEKHDEVLRLAEEQLEVGKRMVETGKTRIRRFVTEREVSADVTLHEEHAELLRPGGHRPGRRGHRLGGPHDRSRRDRRARTGEQDGAYRRGSRAARHRHRPRRDRARQVRRQEVEIERLDASGRPLTPRG